MKIDQQQLLLILIVLLLLWIIMRPTSEGMQKCDKSVPPCPPGAQPASDKPNGQPFRRGDVNGVMSCGYGCQAGTESRQTSVSFS